MATAEETEAKPEGAPHKNGFEGEVFHLDKFKGIGLGGWSVDWKAILNRNIAVMIGLEPKDGLDIKLTTEEALARIGYVKADDLRKLIEAARTALMAVANQHPFPGSQECVDELTSALKAVVGPMPVTPA